MSLLIIGGTGTLGRQIVLQALTKGYKVRCLVRNFKKANFLKEWGAELVYGDLKRPETIPPCLKGITVIIDASAGRSEELDSLNSVDWNGKLSLIKAAKIAKIKRFIFFSYQNANKFEEVPFIKIKMGIEIKLKDSKIPYTIFRLSGFYQGLVEQYAIPILEDLPVWVTTGNVYVAYMDTQDIAKFCIRALQLPNTTTNQTFSLNAPKVWISGAVLMLCEKLAGKNAKTRNVPVCILRLGRYFLGFFSWSQNISDRLAFAELLNTNGDLLPTKASSVHKVFKINSSDIVEIDEYFFEYFICLLKRFRDMNFEDIQKQEKWFI